MYQLQFLTGKFKGKRLTVQQPVLTIGRSPESNVNLDDDDEVSREHAVIEDRSGHPVIRDMGSINPVEVNETKIKEHRLRHGDRIEIGRTVIEYLSGRKKAVVERKHRFSKLQALSFLSIGAIVLLQVLFVLLFPLWQRRELVPIEGLEKPPAAEVEDVPVVDEPTTEPADAASATAVAEEEPEPDEPAETEVAALPDAADVEEVADAPEQPVDDSEFAALEKKFEDAETTPDAPAPERPEVGSFDAQVESMIASAQEQIDAGNLVRADSILDRSQLIAPEFVPAWELRASLFEQRGMPARAALQWERVMQLSRGTPLYDRAAAERARLVGRPQAPEVEPETATKPRRPAVKADLGRRIRIQTIRRERFQATDEFDEMRTVNISLRPSLGEGPVDGSEVLLYVHFYDKVEESGEIVPTRALVPTKPFTIEDEWSAGEAKTLTATYVVGKGFREDEAAQTGETREYAGFRVSLFYEGELQDERAMPRRLLSMPPPPFPELD